MASIKTGPSVEEFREFIKEHPKLRQEVKNGNYTWQELFQEWYLLGGSNEQWETYKEKSALVQSTEKAVAEKSTTEDSEKSDIVSMLMNYMKNMDINQMQKYISNANQALAAIQTLIASLKGEAQKQEEREPVPTLKSDPFVFRKD
jgi:hypothetical protein